MIIVQLKGGLGNQLFQYAAGLSLALHHGVEVKVDTTLLQKPDEQIGTLRSFDLQQFVAAPLVATTNELDEFYHPSFLKKMAEKLLPPYKRSIYKEAAFTYDNNFFSAANHLYLKGYRQSEKYFKRIEPSIKKQFVLKPNSLIHLNENAIPLQQSNSVSIHIRRGDYNNKEVQDYHGVLDKQYFQTAIDHINKEVKGASFFIFSDDIDWVKQELVFDKPVRYISNDVTKTHFEDFYLMQHCKHNIISNSTFSWWAAWLNPNLNKTIIAPKKWFNNAPLNTKDLIPESWMRL